MSPISKICAEGDCPKCSCTCPYNGSTKKCKYGKDDKKRNKFLIVCTEERKNGLPRIEGVVEMRDEVEAFLYAQDTYPKYKEIKIYKWKY